LRRPIWVLGMRALEIDVRREGRGPDEPMGVLIGSHETVFTRLIRHGANAPEDYLEAPPGQMAFWLVDNWWRLLAECVPSSGPTPDWRLAHDLSSMSGFAWPRMAIWGEGDRIGLSSRSDPTGVVGPVRYLTDALVYIPSDEFARSALSFVEQVGSRGAGIASDWAALKAQLDTLENELADAELSEWRRLEAQLGYDVDEAPDKLLEALGRIGQDYGIAAVAEAALATQGASAAAVLSSEINSAMSQHWQCDLTRTALMVGEIDRTSGEAPWELGEKAAAVVRSLARYEKGPLSNAALGEILGVRSGAFRSSQATRPSQRAYGLRLNTGRKRGEVVSLATSWSADRRFEFARALGDAIWTQGEKLGPITRTKSERQKFQRAFAQSLLCPYDDLVAYIGRDASDGALSAAARHFLVSERVVRTLLVNKHQLARSRLNNSLPPSLRLSSEVSFEEAVEAA